jgi:hypothetical protein
MISIAAFHALMLLLAFGVVTRVIPLHSVITILGYLHNSIGITTPPEQQVRTIALIWLASIVVLVDGCLFLTVFLTSLAHAGS